MHHRLVALFCLLAPTLAAQAPIAMVAGVPTEGAVAKAAREFQQSRVAGRELSRAVTRVTRELDWHKKLSIAAKEAQQSGKPIVWIHALGDLKGFT
jgi:hypothetical protein